MDERKPKVMLMLQDSTKGAGGLVIDCEGHTPVNEDDVEGLEVIGSWQKLGDGVIFLELTCAVEARQDVLINLLKDLRESRIREYGSPHILAKYPQATDTSGAGEQTRRRPVRTSAPVEPNVSAGFSSLRDKLKRRA